jgi:hypothetical protein
MTISIALLLIKLYMAPSALAYSLQSQISVPLKFMSISVAPTGCKLEVRKNGISRQRQYHNVTNMQLTRPLAKFAKKNQSMKLHAPETN